MPQTRTAAPVDVVASAIGRVGLTWCCGRQHAGAERTTATNIREPMMVDNSCQKNAAAYRLAALDPDFLLGDSMRGVRLQIECEKAEERLRAWSVRSTIVVFGSARVPSPESVDQAVWQAAALPESRSVRRDEEARSVGRIASRRGR